MVLEEAACCGDLDATDEERAVRRILERSSSLLHLSLLFVLEELFILPFLILYDVKY
ncbi:unnamed protein product [Cuscuta epithymum]|uniref:Uncharacterized protein n=1 Tax=Cuscuta epithymum TaxID=186058 RepID=A0AAV0C2U8_9ASTE|nr:unnamed protein product [Cuscuta epithymum]